MIFTWSFWAFHDIPGLIKYGFSRSVRDEKLQYDINREAAKISALSSGKFDIYEYLTSEEILPSNQSQMIKQAKFTYSPLRKAPEKHSKKQIHVLKALNFSNEIDELKQIESVFPQNQLDGLLIYKLKKSSSYKTVSN